METTSSFWAVLLAIIAVFTQLGQSQFWDRCAYPMTNTGSINFQTPVSSNDSYNFTQYTFDKLFCLLESLIDNRETYRCTTGNIISNFFQILTELDITMDRHVGRIICRTKEQPNIKPQSNVTFICEDTSLVQPEHFCFNTNYECFIQPISFFRNNDRSLNKWEKLVNINSIGFIYFSMFSGGHEFSCPSYFFACFWRRCSSLLMVGTPITEHTEPYYQMKEHYLSQSLENILKTPTVPTSLEITNTNLTYLPDVLCQYKDLQRLAIVYNKIKVLPKCLHEMVKLKILDVSFNALESIEEIDFGSEQPKLYLDLSYNQINSIKQDAFSRLEDLVFLTLSNNLLTYIYLSLPTNLEILDLSHNHIEYIQTGISIPKNLAVFDLSFNQIEFIESRLLETAASLEMLYLNNNRIKVFQLPWDKISGTGFPNLVYINLTKNHIENLDETLFTKEILALDVSYNQIKSIDLGHMKEANNLTELRLDHNNIKEVKDGILNGSKAITILPKIIFLDLSHNQIRVAPLSLIFMKNIRMIDFSKNKIEKCTWSNMPNKYIQKNIDKKFTDSGISELDVLENLAEHVMNLSYNRIRSLQDVFLGTKIMLHKNAMLFGRILIKQNPLHCDCKMYPYFEPLLGVFTQAFQNTANDRDNKILSKSRITKTYKGIKVYMKERLTCETPLRLQSRTLDTELISDLSCNLIPNEKCMFTFHPSDQLLTVNCSNQNLTEIPVINESLELGLKTSMAENQMPDGLKAKIILSWNNFTTLNSSDLSENSLLFFIARKMLADVNVLDLSHSNIHDIDGDFLLYLSTKFPDLTHLYLNNNNLTNLLLNYQIPFFENKTLNTTGCISFWDRVVELHLYSNPWGCSCCTWWMKKWLDKLIARRIIVRPNEIKCAFPDWNQGKMVHIVEDSDFCQVTDPELVTAIIVLLIVILALAVITPPILRWIDGPQPTPLNRDNIKDDNNIKDMEFDAFVLYCEADADWAEQELIPRLEQHDSPYRVCQHKQDFLPWMTTDWNEFHAIKHSRRIIIVCSSFYLSNEHRMKAFRAAISYWICIKKCPRVVVINEVVILKELFYQHFLFLAKDENTIERLLQLMPRESLAQLADRDKMIIGGEKATSRFTSDRQDMIDDDNMEDMEIDVFISYCQPDAEWVEKELIPRLEQYNQSYRVCHHKRCFFLHWKPSKAIKRSRRVIIIMSNSYRERQHCMKEFEAAFSYWIRLKKSPRLVVIKYPDVETKNVPYLRHFAHIVKDKCTFEGLVPFMPRKSLAQLANSDNIIIGRENSTAIFVQANQGNLTDDNNVDDMMFDAFVSYCEKDSEWVVEELIPRLEQHDPPYRVCKHKRDFRPSIPINVNVENAIKHSRRTIVIMSDSYRRSDHCMKEFNDAYEYWICKKNCPGLVVIKYPDVKTEDVMYFRRFTYLEKNEYTFERLFPLMPKESLAQLAERNNVMNGRENLTSLFAPNAEQMAQTLDFDEEERRMEIQRKTEELAKQVEDVVSEADERIEAGEDISAKDLMDQRLGPLRHRSTKH